MAPWFSDLSASDAFVIVLTAVLLVLAMASAIALFVIVMPRTRRAGAQSVTTAIGVLAALELVGLVAAAPLGWFSAMDTLSRFGAQNMVATILAPEARFGLPLLFALVLANAAAISVSYTLPRS